MRLQGNKSDSYPKANQGQTQNPELAIFKSLNLIPGAFGAVAHTLTAAPLPLDAKDKTLMAKPRPSSLPRPEPSPHSIERPVTARTAPSKTVFPYEGLAVRKLKDGRYEATSPLLGRFEGTLNQIGAALPVAASLRANGHSGFEIKDLGSGVVSVRLQDGRLLSGTPTQIGQQFPGFYQRVHSSTQFSPGAGHRVTRLISKLRAGQNLQPEELLILAPLLGVPLKNPGDFPALQNLLRTRVRQGNWVGGPNPPVRLAIGADPPLGEVARSLVKHSGDVGATLNQYNPFAMFLKTHAALYGIATGDKERARKGIDNIDQVSRGIGRFGGEALPMVALGIAAPEIAGPLGLALLTSSIASDAKGIPEWIKTGQPPEGGLLEGLAQSGRVFHVGQEDPWTAQPVSLEDAAYGGLSILDQAYNSTKFLDRHRLKRGVYFPTENSIDGIQMGSQPGAHPTFEALKVAAREQLAAARRQFAAKHGKSEVAPNDTTSALRDAKRLGALYYSAGIRTYGAWAAILKRDCGAWFAKHASLVFDEVERIWLQKVLRRTGEVVSTRSPSNTKSRSRTILRSDGEAMQEDPAHLAQRLTQLGGHDGFQDVSGSYDATIQRGADNLSLVHDIAHDIAQKGRKNVIGQNYQMNELVREFGITKEQAAGVLAVLSMQKRWEENVAMARNLVKSYLAIQDRAWTPEMSNKVAEIHQRKRNSVDLSDVVNQAFADLRTDRQRAKWLRVYDETYNDLSYHELTPRGRTKGKDLKLDQSPKKYAWSTFKAIEKAMRILESSSLDQIQRELGRGHKVPNFYNNIVNPWHPGNFAVVDTHGVGAAHHRPLGGGSLIVRQHFGGDLNSRSRISGMKGSYGLYHDMTERAARQKGYKYTNQFQGAIWEVMRTISRHLTKDERTWLAAMWSQVGSGNLSLEKARQLSTKMYLAALSRSRN